MKKQSALTFLLGAIFGGGISAFYFSGTVVREIVPGEVKVLTKTEYRDVTAPAHSIQNDLREVTKFPDHSPEESVHDADEIGKYESTEGDEASQMEKFERSMASEQSNEEESPAENNYEPPPVEEPSEN